MTILSSIEKKPWFLTEPKNVLLVEFDQDWTNMDDFFNESSFETLSRGIWVSHFPLIFGLKYPVSLVIPIAKLNEFSSF